MKLTSRSGIATSISFQTTSLSESLVQGKEDDSQPSFSGQDELTKDYDMVLVCKDGVRLHVHTLILSKWSLVISAFPDLQRKNEGRLGDIEFPVEDESVVWREVLGLIYPVTPVTILDWDNVGRIFDLADKYNMLGILERCESFLMNPQCVLSSGEDDGNYVLKWLAFAAKYEQKKLHEKCMQYIRLHYKSINELRSPSPNGYLRRELATTPSGVDSIIEIMSFVIKQRR